MDSASPPAPAPTYEDGVRLQREQRWAEAAAVYREVARDVVTVRVAANLGHCLYELGELAEAERWLLLASRHWAGVPDLRQRLGAVYSAQDRVDLAELEYRTALALNPDYLQAKLSLSALLLSVGRFAEGWPLMDARVQLHERVVPKVNLSCPEWLGEPLDGRAVFVQVEQGLGDQLQMCRFAGELKARGAGRVTLACRSPLAPLLLSVPGVDATVALDARGVAQVGPHDCWTRYFSVPWRLGTTLRTLPNAPYIFAPADRLARWRPDAKVGLAWQASPEGFNGRNKSLPPELAKRILDLGAISLQPEDTGVADMADTAAIVAGLDLVISIDSAVAHLAGAMGKPTWTLLPNLKTDWRWMRGRTDSPWYPSMRLFRQAQPGDWAPTVDAVCAELAAR
jgi:tetratricopeptide (TPR) repeat protein